MGLVALGVAVIGALYLRSAAPNFALVMFTFSPSLSRVPAQAHIFPLGYHTLVAGIIFGFGVGMVVARGCVSGNLYRSGEAYVTSWVAVLNGGYPKWAAESREVTRVAPKVNAATFVVKVDAAKVATKQYVQDNLANPKVVLLDVRLPQEYSGQDVRAKRGGHIPGAVNVEWTQSATSDQVPVFKSVSELTALYQGAGVTKDKEIITYC